VPTLEYVGARYPSCISADFSAIHFNVKTKLPELQTDKVKHSCMFIAAVTSLCSDILKGKLIQLFQIKKAWKQKLAFSG